MRIVYMGTPDFAATILEDLAQHHEIVAVYTRPDAVRGRGKGLVASPVKTMAKSLGIPVYTPRSLRSEEEQWFLSDMKPDVICVAAYGMILPRGVLDIPLYGCLNVHASLLPRWRGAAPVERAILAGDEQAGVCVMRMEEGLDTGDFCVSRSVPIENKSAAALTDELATLGSKALLTALHLVEQKSVRWTKQDEAAVTYAAKIEKGELDPDVADTCETFLRKVRASSAAHPARCVLADRGVTVLAAAAVETDCCEPDVLPAAGEVSWATKRLLFGCVDGVVEIKELKPDGKQAMLAAAFAAGMPALRQGSVIWEGKNVSGN